MGQPSVGDVIEIEQLLARYAVGMTKDDIDEVLAVFTPDGTYSAFGDTTSLVDFPRSGCGGAQGPLPGGPPGYSTSTATPGRPPTAVLRGPGQPHKMRIGLLHRHLPPDGTGVAARHQVHDLCGGTGAGTAVGRTTPPVRARAAPDGPGGAGAVSTTGSMPTPRPSRRAGTGAWTPRWPTWPRCDDSPTTPGGPAGDGRPGWAAWGARPSCAPTWAKRSPVGAWSSRASTR